MRLLSILLLMVMGLPMASPLLALTGAADEHVLACCRRNGKHHCTAMTAMAGTSDASATQPQLRPRAEKCPLYPQASMAAAHDLATPPSSQAIFAALVSHPAGTEQTESRWRVSRYRSRQKRGPPARISS